jgi:hypothetical protein
MTEQIIDMPVSPEDERIKPILVFGEWNWKHTVSKERSTNIVMWALIANFLPLLTLMFHAVLHFTACHFWALYKTVVLFICTTCLTLSQLLLDTVNTKKNLV